jgi:putative hydrolase of the HAD superfamily
MRRRLFVTRPILAVTFDVGGTLIKPWPSVGHVYARVAARHGIRGVSPANLSRAFKWNWSQQERFDYSRGSWRKVVVETFRKAGASIPDSPCFDDIYREFARPEAWRIFPDVLPTLEYLAERGIRLGIVSNWDERLRPLLRRLGLLRRFRGIIISSEVGAAKPSLRIFELAARRLEVAPKAVLHIGDSFSLDVQGARVAGFKGLHLKRGASAARGRVGSLLDLINKPY